MTVIVWGLVLSIQWRNPLVLSAGDTLLRLLLFWAMFLPLGAVWSVDQARGGGSGRSSTRMLSMATVGLFLQITFVYWFSVILKSGDEWRLDGSALYYALSLDQLTTPFGASLLAFPALLTFLTFATLGIEAVGPFLLLSPIANGPVRTAGIVTFIGLHLGILLTMDLGIFSWLGAYCMLGLLPGWFWDTALPRLRTALPARIRTGPDGPLTVTQTAVRSSRTVNVFAGVSLIYVLVWNLTTVTDLQMPALARPLANVLGLKQEWDMFAPRPSTVTGWYVIEGTLGDGRKVELLTSIIQNDFARIEDVSWERPERISDTFAESKYWRKYLDDIRGLSGPGYRSALSDYACREWNEVHDGGETLVIVRIVVMKQETLPDRKRGAPVQDASSFHACRSAIP